MSFRSKSPPGAIWMFCGAVFLALSAGLATNWAPGPRGSEFVNGVIGVALLMWGWSRLRRAKAARPDLSWWQYLHVELIAVAILLVWLPIFAAMSAEQRKSLVDWLLELAQLIQMAKGPP